MARQVLYGVLYTEASPGFPGLPRCLKHRRHLLSLFMLWGIERKYLYFVAYFIAKAKTHFHSIRIVSGHMMKRLNDSFVMIRPRRHCRRR
jgi:hypothetical protein